MLGAAPVAKSKSRCDLLACVETIACAFGMRAAVHFDCMMRAIRRAEILFTMSQDCMFGIMCGRDEGINQEFEHGAPVDQISAGAGQAPAELRIEQTCQRQSDRIASCEQGVPESPLTTRFPGRVLAPGAW